MKWSKSVAWSLILFFDSLSLFNSFQGSCLEQLNMSGREWRLVAGGQDQIRQYMIYIL